jgi:hypothetical protein
MIDAIPLSGRSISDERQDFLVSGTWSQVQHLSDLLMSRNQYGPQMNPLNTAALPQALSPSSQLLALGIWLLAVGFGSCRPRGGRVARNRRGVRTKLAHSFSRHDAICGAA